MTANDLDQTSVTWTLPFPSTHGEGRRAWKRAVHRTIFDGQAAAPPGPLAVTIRSWPPEKSPDPDNLAKPVLDAVLRALLSDDRQVWRLVVERQVQAVPCADARIVVEIRAHEAGDAAPE